MKQKAFLIIFKGLSVAKNCPRSESGPLSFITLLLIYIKGAVADIRYFAWSKFSRSLVYKKNFWHDMTSSFQGYVFCQER